MDELRSEWRAILKQGALLLLGLLIVLVGGYYAIYQLSWGSAPHWIEAHRDRYRIANLAENVHWFWIHQDSQYWIVRVRFDRGPVTLEGLPPHARYWSVTYYAGNEENPSINMQSVQLDDDGTYRITFTQEPGGGAANQIPVGQGVRRGIIELRITLQEVSQPVLLPSVSQDGVVIVEGGAR
jgi:hypothetical protein